MGSQHRTPASVLLLLVSHHKRLRSGQTAKAKGQRSRLSSRTEFCLRQYLTISTQVLEWRVECLFDGLLAHCTQQVCAHQRIRTHSHSTGSLLPWQNYVQIPPTGFRNHQVGRCDLCGWLSFQKATQHSQPTGTIKYYTNYKRHQRLVCMCKIC